MTQDEEKATMSDSVGSIGENANAVLKALRALGELVDGFEARAVDQTIGPDFAGHFRTMNDEREVLHLASCTTNIIYGCTVVSPVTEDSVRIVVARVGDTALERGNWCKMRLSPGKDGIITVTRGWTTYPLYDLFYRPFYFLRIDII